MTCWEFVDRLTDPTEIIEKYARMAELKVGVVADTHIPDQAEGLHPALLTQLKAASVDLILHAGDICLPFVLDPLKEAAPVIAVRGNRDLFFAGRRIPSRMLLELGGVRVGLTHGHISLSHYLVDKVRHFASGYELDRYISALEKIFPMANVIIFGHTHFPANEVRNGKLFFNPGAANYSPKYRIPPSYGILSIKNGKASGEIHRLEGYSLKRRKWLKSSG